MAKGVHAYRNFWDEPAKYLLVVPDRIGPGAPPEASELAMIACASTMAAITIECSLEETLQVLRRMRAAGVRVLTAGEFRLRSDVVNGRGNELPALVCASESGSAHHVRLSDGRFQRVVAGASQPIHTGYEHILVVEQLAVLLARYAQADIAVLDAVIYDPKTKTESRAYKEIVPTYEITPELLADGAFPPAKAWHFRREALFLARPLPSAIRDFPGLGFEPGFSGYAGGRR